MINPFILHEGRVYLIEGWHERMTGDRKMIIRPLTAKETAIWRRNFEEFGYETYAQIVTKPEKGKDSDKGGKARKKNRS